MPIDTQTQGSPGWWLKRLSRALADKRERLDRLDAYERGDPPLPEGAEGCREAYRTFQRKARSNYAKLVVAATSDRMKVTGFRTGAEGDENGDREANRIWAANSMPIESTDVHRTMLTLGESYVIVGGPDDESNLPVITGEDPRQVITAHDPRLARRVRAGLKMFRDDESEQDMAYLYLPGQVWVARRQRGRSPSGQVRFSPQSWDWDEDLSAELPYPVVPVVRFRNEGGVGEFEEHTDHLDRINHMLLQRLVIATMQAFRQRAIKGDLPTHDKKGREIDYDELFKADPGALWHLPEGVELWESEQADLTSNLTSVRHDVQDLAAVTRTPMHYLDPGGENQSAEGAQLAREGLVFKAEDRIERAKASWAQVASLAFRFADQPKRADLLTLETLMAPAERYSLAERYDAGVKAVTAAVPWRTRMTHVLQFTPDQVAEMEPERLDDMLLQPAAGPQQGEQLAIPEAA